MISRFRNQASWRIDPDGFMRCTATILKTGVMKYHRSEIPEELIPESILDEWIFLMVDAEELGNGESLKSLEGKSMVIGHDWQETGNVTDVGNVAGAPYFDGEYLIAEPLVTDSIAIERIMLDGGDSRKLQDLSSAYDSKINWESGYDGDDYYHGSQVNLRYNHVALLGIGDGRAGTDVRILNKKEVTKVEFTTVKFGNSRVRIANEDMEKMNMEMDNADSEKEEMKGDMMTPEMKTMLADYTSMKENMSEMEAKMMAMKDQLEEAMGMSSPEAIEGAAEIINEDREESAKMMNAAGVDSKEIVKLSGVALKAATINAIRLKNGSAGLTEDQAKDPSFLNAYYSAIKDMPAQVIKPASLSMGNDEATRISNNKASMSDNQSNITSMYGKKESK